MIEPKDNTSRLPPREPAEHSRRRRARTLRSCGAAWEHLAAHGLGTDLVADTLRAILREEQAS